MCKISLTFKLLDGIFLQRIKRYSFQMFFEILMKPN